MFSAEIYSSRRATLREKVGKGIILLPGNGESPSNYPNNTFHFRQDSTFLYFFGQNLPDLVGVIDCESGEEILFGNDLTVDDIIWTGPQPTIADLASQVGVGATRPMAALADYLSVDRSAMSRELGKMKDEDIIKVEHRKITLL